MIPNITNVAFRGIKINEKMLPTLYWLYEISQLILRQTSYSKGVSQINEIFTKLNFKSQSLSGSVELMFFLKKLGILGLKCFFYVKNNSPHRSIVNVDSYSDSSVLKFFRRSSVLGLSRIPENPGHWFILFVCFLYVAVQKYSVAIHLEDSLRFFGLGTPYGFWVRSPQNWHGQMLHTKFYWAAEQYGSDSDSFSAQLSSNFTH